MGRSKIGGTRVTDLDGKLLRSNPSFLCDLSGSDVYVVAPCMFDRMWQSDEIALDACVNNGKIICPDGIRTVPLFITRVFSRPLLHPGIKQQKER